MKKYTLGTITVLMATLMVMCSSPKKEITEQIETLRDSLFGMETGRLNMNTANNLISAYIKFADDFPDDTLTPGYLFNAGEMCMNLNKPQMAIQLYDRILNTYPDYDRTPQSLFLKGYIYENLLNDLEKAKIIYEEFLARYPDDDFADDAEMSIKNLGKSPEELIREFDEKQKQEAEKTTI
ncbi:MAG: tetratricopeptide repeat protein [Bacteroidales bacterium]|nr:tetratricopeptide repeat protein [Bacteroidales bacterium]